MGLLVNAGGVSLLLDLLVLFRPYDESEHLIDLQITTVDALLSVTELSKFHGDN